LRATIVASINSERRIERSATCSGPALSGDFTVTKQPHKSIARPTRALGDAPLSIFDTAEVSFAAISSSRRPAADPAAEIAALKETSERFRTIIDSTAEGIILLLSDGSVGAANASASALLGLPMDELMRIQMGPSPIEATWEDGRPVQTNEVPGYFTLLTGRPLTDVELSIVRPSGGNAWLSINSRPLIREGETLPYAVVASFVDITARKQAEIASAHRERRLELLHEMSQEITAGMSEDQIIHYTVRRLAREFPVFRTSYASVNEAGLAQTAHAVVPKGMPEIPRASLDLTAGGEYVDALRAGRVLAIADAFTDPRFASNASDLDRLVFQSMLKVPVRYLGRLAGFLAISGPTPHNWTEQEVRMVTDVASYLTVAIGRSRAEAARRAVEENLRRSEERFRALVRNSSDILAVLDAAGRFLDITPAVERVLGYDPGELLGRTNLACIHPADRRRLGRCFLRCLKDPVQRQTVELRCLHKSGPWRWLEVIMHSLVADPAVAGIIVNVRDITERREAAEVLQRANEQLAAVNQAKSDFVAIVSHEFRTPLTGIRGFSELIRDQSLAPAEIREYANDINADAQRLERMIDDILDLERMQSGFAAIEPKSVDLNTVISAAVQLAKPTSSLHRFVLELAADLPQVAGDADKMYQVMNNLITNAIKYSPAGGEIRIESSFESGYAHVLVRDEGVGIPTSALDKIFERYARIETTNHKVIKGTGLGLPIVRQIVELHHGRIWAESTPGAGATFHVLLPRYLQTA
jgi:PAS domain S-box-containing protein